MLENIRVSEWMTSPVVSVNPDTPVKEAHQLMKERRIRRLPVVDQDRLVGIITIGDIREASPSDATSLSIWELNYLWDQLTVKKVMTTGVISVRPDDTILSVAYLMLENKISGMPVVDEHGKLVGIITESDIFKMLVQARSDEPRKLAPLPSESE